MQAQTIRLLHLGVICTTLALTACKKWSNVSGLFDDETAVIGSVIVHIESAVSPDGMSLLLRGFVFDPEAPSADTNSQRPLIVIPKSWHLEESTPTTFDASTLPSATQNFNTPETIVVPMLVVSVFDEQVRCPESTITLGVAKKISCEVLNLATSDEE